MRIISKIDYQYEDTEVTICTNDEVEAQRIEQLLRQGMTPYALVGYQERSAEVITFDDIVRIYTENKIVWLDTMNSTYRLRERIYELEEVLDSRRFVKVSQGEFIHLKYVKRLDLSYQRTIAVELTNGETVFVAYRALKAFKQSLGMK